MDPPSVSIIVATYQAGKTLETCLRSVLAQAAPHWQLIVIDGGSSDATVGLLKHYSSRIAYWHSRADAGIYDAWNQALDHATCDYVCFLGADDAWSDPGALRSLIEAIGEERPDIVSGKGELVDEAGKPLGRIGRDWNHRALRRRIRICHPGALFRRDLFERFGRFDLRYRIVADYEWLLRLPASTSFRFVDRIVVRVGHAGISRARVWQRLRERRLVHARCPRIGPFWAYVYWLDKLWRMPIARALRLQY